MRNICKYILIISCSICISCNKTNTINTTITEKSEYELPLYFDSVTDSVKDKIKNYEGLKLHTYIDGNGKMAIGYGHIQKNQWNQIITKEQANILFEQDLKIFEKFINSLNICYTQNEFDALVSFTYNIGTTRFLNSRLYAKIKCCDDIDNIIKEFKEWRMSNGKIAKGLVNRREWELHLYLWDYYNNNCQR